MRNTDRKPPRRKLRITLELNFTTEQLLRVLGDPKQVIEQLVDHAQQGVYRPGAWERQWVEQVFGDEFVSRLEAGDPFNREGGEAMFQRPARGGGS